LLYQRPNLKAKTTAAFIQITQKLLNEPAFYAEGLKLSAELIKQFDQEKIRQELIDLYKELAEK
jgi:glycosyltransferase involved in cell wall biosynthesis